MTKFAHAIRLIAHNKNGTSDCSEKDNTEVFLVDNGVEENYWCTPAELLVELRRRARVAQRRNHEPADDNGATIEQVEPTLNN